MKAKLVPPLLLGLLLTTAQSPAQSRDAKLLDIFPQTGLNVSNPSGYTTETSFSTGYQANSRYAGDTSPSKWTITDPDLDNDGILDINDTSPIYFIQPDSASTIPPVKMVPIPNAEQDAFLAEMVSTVKSTTSTAINAKRSFAIRIGKGGQIYSIRGAFGEAVGPQWRRIGKPSTASSDSLNLYGNLKPLHYERWIDEVFQTTAVDSARNPNDDAPETFHVHQAGTYLYKDNNSDPYDGSHRTFYCPTLASGPGSVANSYVVVSWGQMAQIPTWHRSYVIYSSQFRCAGPGILEVTTQVYNYEYGGTSSADLDYFGAPWAGVRRTSLPNLYVKTAGGSTILYESITDAEAINGRVAMPPFRDETQGNSSQPGAFDLSSTQGFFIWEKPGGTATTNPSMCFVTGTTEADSVVRKPSRVRFGQVSGQGIDTSLKETAWRNLNLFAMQRYPYLDAGEIFTYRYYLTFAVQGNQEGIVTNGGSNSVVANATAFVTTVPSLPDPQAAMNWSVNNGDVVSNGSGGTILTTYSKPAQSFKPVFCLKKTDGKRILTQDPYKYTNTSEMFTRGTTTAQLWKADEISGSYDGFLGYAHPSAFATSAGAYSPTGNGDFLLP